MEVLLPYIIICPLVFIAGFIDAIAGGGGLISLPAYLIAGLPVHNAIATNKMSSCMGTSLATIRLLRNQGVDVVLGVSCAAVALVGSALGANLALAIDERVFKVIMLVVVPLTAAYVLTHKSIESDKGPLSKGATLAVCVCSSFVMGVYDGVYGPGTGTFLILLFTTFAHLRIASAASLCKVVNLTTNISALTVFIVNGKTLLLLGFTAGLFNMAGAWFGVNAFKDKGTGIVKPVMLLVLCIFFVKMIYDLVVG